MNELVIGRTLYWVGVAFLILLTTGLEALSNSLLQSLSQSLARHVEISALFGFGIMLSFVVGARFADIGWPRWLGVALVVLIIFVTPPALYFGSPHEARDATYRALPTITGIPLTFLLVFAGVIRGSSCGGRIRISR